MKENKVIWTLTLPSALGYLGAAAYFIHNAHGFWATMWAPIQAIPWPAYLVFLMLDFFKA